MPYYEIDPELVDEIPMYGEPNPSASFYEAAESQFAFDQTDGPMRDLYEALVEKGFDAVVCRYDGGYDEGFAYFETATVKGTTFGVAELGELFKDGPLGEATAADLDGYPEAVRQQILERIESMPREQRIAGLLEEFAGELAVNLLGQGFGTGEITLRGRFRAHLGDGRIEDLAEDPGPSDNY